jgi:transcriptional regulator with XRE-family HTH domain
MTKRRWTSGGTRLRALREHAGKTQLAVEVEADLGSGYLQRIESGKVVHPLRQTLERILTAIDARHSERREVLELFGYTAAFPLPTEGEINRARALICSELHQATFPAYLLDCGHRLLAWNRYVPRIIGVAPNQMARFTQVCMFDLWFSPGYRLSSLVDNPETFFPAVMHALRHEMQPFRNEGWCTQLIARLVQELPLFSKYWRMVEHMSGYTTAARTIVPVQLDVPHVGLLQFRLSVEHFTWDARFRMVYYLPADQATMQRCAWWAELDDSNP